MKKQVSAILLAGLLSVSVPMHADGWKNALYGLGAFGISFTILYLSGGWNHVAKYLSSKQSDNQPQNNPSNQNTNEQPGSSSNTENPLEKKLQEDKEKNQQNNASEIPNGQKIDLEDKNKQPSSSSNTENPLEKKLQEDKEKNQQNHTPEKQNNRSQKNQKSFSSYMDFNYIKHEILAGIKREKETRNNYKDSGFDYNS